MPRKVAKKRVEAAANELGKVRKQWLRRPGVTAVDVGYKIKDNQLTSDLAVRVHVARKLPKAVVIEAEAFNSGNQPDQLGGFPVDVIEADYGPAVAGPLEADNLDRMGRIEPIIGGISCGNPRVSAGTVGAIVWDRRDGAACILSNWHVLCRSLTASVGEPILQPAVMDGGGAGDQVAELTRWRLDSDADAAIARLLAHRSYSRDVLGLNPLCGMEEPQLGMHVVKSGRTTGLTRGIIDGVHASVRIDYVDKVQQFDDQMHIVPDAPWPEQDYEVSKGGDSGAVWVNKSNGMAVGLHFAGEKDRSPAAENAMANRITRVAELLEFSVTPLFLPPPPTADPALMAATREVLCNRFPELCESISEAEFAGPAAAAVETSAPASGATAIEAVMKEIDRVYRQSRR